MPALLVLDGLEVLCPAAAAAGDPGLVEPGGDALTAWLCDTLSALRGPSRMPLPGTANIKCFWPQVTIWFKQLTCALFA
jgi:hypothetical protein